METLHVDRTCSEVNNRGWREVCFVGCDAYRLLSSFPVLCGETLPIKRSVRREFWQLNIVMEMLSCP